MQTSKARNGSSETPHKTSPITPKTSRISKMAGSESDSSTSKLTPRKTSIEKSPKITDRRSSKSPVVEKKRANKLSELENQIAQLQEDIKKTKDQLSSSESSKKRIQLEAEEAKKYLTAMAAKLQESQCQLVEFSAAEDARLQQLHEISHERDKAWQSELEALQKQHSADSVALGSAMNEIQRLKQELRVVMKSETSQEEDPEMAQTELEALKEDLAALQKQYSADSVVLGSAMNEIQMLKQELCVVMKSETSQEEDPEMAQTELEALKEDLAAANSIVANLEAQISDKEKAEEKAKFTLSETLKQLGTANATIETLRAEGHNLLESLDSTVSKSEESIVRVSALEEMVRKLQASVEEELDRKKPPQKVDSGASESELEQLKAALESAEARRQEEQIHTTMQIQSVYEMAEHVRVVAGLRESELESTLQKAEEEFLELKARLHSTETEHQSLSQMNKELKDEMEKAKANEFDAELKLMKATTDVTELKAKLLDKETEVQGIMEENELLKSELTKRETEHQKNYAAAITDAERARAAEQEALKRLGPANSEAEKNSARAARLAEQLEAAQAMNSEMESELRRLRVQTDQWRKAAEAAAAALSPGNNGRIVERTGSLDSDNNSISGKLMSSPFSDDPDEESPKKKNSNVLKKIGGLWKKGPK